MKLFSAWNFLWLQVCILALGFHPASAIDVLGANLDAPTATTIVPGASSSAAPGSLIADLLQQSPGLLQQLIGNVVAIATFVYALIPNPDLAFYGQSPPIYPSPNGTGDGKWATAYAQARAFVQQMTLDEKNTFVYGASDNQGCSGFIPAISRLQFPGICLNDGPTGVRGAEPYVNAYPAQLHMGASWNRNLTAQRGRQIGAEFKAKGVNVALGPVVGPLGRIALGGRNWEGFGNDPYLAGELVGPTISAMQESTIACVKHFIANEQETNRLPFLAGYVGNFNQSVSSNLDDKTMHELYLWPFYDAIKAGVGSTMCSYQRINNSYACQNSKTINGLLKTELGFRGFVVSDWNAQRSGLASALAGLDITMPTSIYWNNGNLASAVKNGTLDVSRLDDMVVRTMAAYYRYAPYKTPSINSNSATNARVPAANSLLFQAAVEGHVLVKNINNALPLSKPKSLALFGFDGTGGLNGSTTTPFLTQFGLQNAQTFEDGSPFTDIELELLFAEALPASSLGPAAALNGTLIIGGGSGTTNPPLIISPFDAFLKQANTDGTSLTSDFTSPVPRVTGKPDACIVFVNELASESWDRPGLASLYADNLVIKVASQCHSTIVSIHNAGIRLVERWIDHPNITAVIFAHLPGQESGSSLVELIYGRQSPSGRLPYTVARKESDYGTLLNPTLPDASNPFYSQSNFNEGLFIDYKHFIQQGITPRYPFGYGLTYSNFSYTNLKVSKMNGVNLSRIPPGATTNASGVKPEGGLASLYDVLATVSATVTNTGRVSAAEVAQLYIQIPTSPLPLVLRGFDKHLIGPGANAVYTFNLRRRDLSTWDSNLQQWVLPPGRFDMLVGKSVADIQLRGALML